MTPFDRPQSSLVTMILLCTVFDTINFEIYCDLEIRNKGRSVNVSKGTIQQTAYDFICGL